MTIRQGCFGFSVLEAGLSMSSLKYGLSVLELCQLLSKIIHISELQCPLLQDEDSSESAVRMKLFT